MTEVTERFGWSLTEFIAGLFLTECDWWSIWGWWTCEYSETWASESPSFWNEIPCMFESRLWFPSAVIRPWLISCYERRLWLTLSSALLSAFFNMCSRNSALFLGQRPWVQPNCLAWKQQDNMFTGSVVLPQWTAGSSTDSCSDLNISFMFHPKVS